MATGKTSPASAHPGCHFSDICAPRMEESQPDAVTGLTLHTSWGVPLPLVILHLTLPRVGLGPADAEEATTGHVAPNIRLPHPKCPSNQARFGSESGTRSCCRHLVRPAQPGRWQVLLQRCLSALYLAASCSGHGCPAAAGMNTLFNDF